MRKIKRTNQPRLLTEVELELMGILWRLGRGSVTEVIAELPKERKLAYTSVSTILRILEQKKVVCSLKEGRGHTYIPVLEKTEYEATSLNHLVTTVFDGTPTSVVRRLLDAEDLTPEDIASIRELLAEKSRTTGDLVDES